MKFMHSGFYRMMMKMLRMMLMLVVVVVVRKMMTVMVTAVYTGKDLLLFSVEFLSPSSSESLSTMGGTRISTCRLSLCTTSCSFPRDFSISLPASLRDRFSVTVPLI